MDNIDNKILGILQRDSTLNISELAEQVGLTTTPCWRRIQQLEKNGIIKKRVALLDPEKLGLGMTVFVQIKAGKHDGKWLENFARNASLMDEITEFYRMSGEYDYMLKVIVKDMVAFDHFYKRLIASANLSDVTSSFAMEQIKYSTALPL